jgi:hypothetical protein
MPLDAPRDASGGGSSLAPAGPRMAPEAIVTSISATCATRTARKGESHAHDHRAVRPLRRRRPQQRRVRPGLQLIAAHARPHTTSAAQVARRGEPTRVGRDDRRRRDAGGYGRIPGRRGRGRADPLRRLIQRGGRRCSGGCRIRPRILISRRRGDRRAGRSTRRSTLRRRPVRPTRLENQSTTDRSSPTPRPGAPRDRGDGVTEESTSGGPPIAGDTPVEKGGIDHVRRDAG